jgi:hypothetical protein
MDSQSHMLHHATLLPKPEFPIGPVLPKVFCFFAALKSLATATIFITEIVKKINVRAPKISVQVLTLHTHVNKMSMMLV